MEGQSKEYLVVRRRYIETRKNSSPVSYEKTTLSYKMYPSLHVPGVVTSVSGSGSKVTTNDTLH